MHKRKTATESRSDIRRFALRAPLGAASVLVLALSGVLSVSQSLAAPPLPPGTVPTGGVVTSGVAGIVTAAQLLTINQQSARAIINWQSFNISPDSAVRFNHLTGATGTTLNRIFDANPSVIQGRMSANGQVYLINQNGIIFDGGSQINVGGLVASTLNITDDLFLSGILSNASPATTPVFTVFNNGQPTGMIRVEPGAEIRTEREGRVMLLAPQVQNGGLIATPEGQTILAAGEKVYLAASTNPTLRGLLVEVDNGGAAENLNLGQIVAERGNITLVGLAVNQSGRISATTTVNANGSIRLLARDTVTVASQDGVNVPRGSRTGSVVLGAGSVTEVLPELANAQTSFDEQTFNRSNVEVLGKNIHLQENSVIRAAGGNVTLSAQAGLDFHSSDAPPVADARIYLAPGAVIDVAGTSDVAVPIERNIVEVELRGDELKDSPLQRNGFLRGKKVLVDSRKEQPTPLADVSGFTSQVPRTVAERTAEGGSIVMRSEGDVILREGSVLNVSGGGIQYQDGYLKTSKLVSEGRIYDIGSAPANRVYDGFADTYIKDYGRWGVVEVFQALDRGEFAAGYYEGKSAGSVAINAHGVVFDGSLRGKATPGQFQRDLATAPLGGRLVIGDPLPTSTVADYRIAGFDFSNLLSPLSGAFDFSSPLALDQVLFPTDIVTSGGFSRLELYSNGAVNLPAGVNLAVAPGGSVALTGRQINMLGSITAPAGNIALTTTDTRGPVGVAADYGITVGAGARLDASGLWTNDSPAVTIAPTGPIATAGGTVSIRSTYDANLGAGSVVNVSGGGWVQANDKVKGGNAGSINIESGNIVIAAVPQQGEVRLNGELSGYAIGKGGALSINAPEVTVTGQLQGVTTGIELTPAFFHQGGFKDFTLRGRDGVTVTDNSVITPLPESLVLGADFRTRPSGSDILAFSSREVLPVEQRAAQKITLNASSTQFGELEIGAGAAIRVDPGGEIKLNAGRQLTVLGTLDAPAGKIALTLPEATESEPFDATQSIWLGSASRLLARGDTRIVTDNRGLRKGEILNGGSVTISAGRGYVVGEQGALIDVSGTTGVLDINQESATPGVAPASVPTLIASDAGSIAVASREGILFDGTLMGAPGAASARGGALSVALDYRSVLPGYPGGPREVHIAQSGSSVPAGLAPGLAVPGSQNGQARVTADQLAAGGFDELSVKSRERVVFDGNVNLAVRRSVALDAPVIAASAGTQAGIEAAYVALGNRDVTRQTLQTASGGSGSDTLSVHAKLIDLEGQLALQGLDTVNLTASEDVRAKGALNTATGRELRGTLAADGDLTFTARQVYPTTFSNFTISTTADAGNTIAFNRNGADTPVLSAGGKLTVNAPEILQQGVIKAPFGEIALVGGDALTMGAGSITSVSAEGQLIPFGKTELAGIDYVYTLGAGNAVIQQGPPAKTVRLDSKAVTVAAGARIDVSGGGDTYAYEFIPGPGGSRDVLAPAIAAGSFAVVPGMVSEFAPYDHQYQLDVTGLKPGDRVYLAGGSDLPAGSYTLLPARYALLPGAFLVTPKAGTTDMQGSQAQNNITGTQLVSGYRSATSRDGTLIRDSRTSGFEVKSGALVRNEAEYRETTAGRHFADRSNVQQTGDAGRLSVAATQSLVLNGNLVTVNDPGRRGAEVDITAPKLAITAPGGATVGGSGFVELSAASLNNLNAASLLLGGTRSSTADGVSIVVGSSEVVVANTSAQALAAPEILIAATDRVALLDGSVVRGADTFTGTARDISIGSTASGVNGEGALLRASSGPQVDMGRDNINAVNPARGRLEIASGSVVGGRSVILDATLSNRFGGTLELDPGGALALGANRISAGDTADVVTGLAFSNTQLAALGNPTDLLLRSYSTLDLFGAALVGNADLGSLVIESAGIGGYQNSGLTARIEAQSVTLRNPRAITFSNAPALAGGAVPVTGNGALQVAGRTVNLGDGTVEVKGFNNATVTAQRELLAAGEGTLKTTGSLHIEATRMAAAPGADYAITVTSGTFSTALPAAPAADLAAAGLGGQLSVTAPTIIHGGRFDLPSGVLELKATGAAGPGGQGSVTLAAGSQINTAGRTEQFFDLPVATRGGEVVLSSGNANVLIAANALVDVSGADGADAGALTIRAANGGAQIDGLLKGGANPRATTPGSVPRQSEFVLDVATLGDFNQLNQLLNASLDGDDRIVSGGFSESREIRVRSGDVSIGTAVDPAVTVTARRFQLAADNGDISVYGTIDASGDKGGQVALLAGRGANPNAGDVMVYSGARIDARGTEAVAAPFGTRGEGGSVMLGSAASGGQVNVAAGSTIDVSGAGAARGGQVILRAQRNGTGNDVPVTALGEISGAREVIAEGYKVYTATNITGAGVNSATNFNASTTGTAFTEAQNFVNNTRANAGGVRSRLSASAAASFHLRAGVEVQSPGDLAVRVNEATTATDQTTPALHLRGWNLGAWRFGSGTADAGYSQEPGVLTLRAAGNVNLNSSIGDGFSSATNRLMNEWGFLTADNTATANVREDNSWSIRIASGADLAAANPLVVNAAGTGNINLADNKLVRTGNGAIEIAAGGNLNLNGAGAVIYTAGVAGPVYADYTLPNLGLLVQSPPLIRRPQFPDQGGDLTIRVGGDINATASEQLFTGWLQRQGKLDSDGNIESSSQPGWWVRFDGSRLSNNSGDARYLQGGFRQGVGALGGGDVVVEAAGNINKLSVSTPTNGRLRGADGSVPDAANLVVQGGGDIRVDSGGDILSGLFYVDRGRADIVARGDIGKAADRPVSTILALGDGQMNLSAGGNIIIEGVVNPTMLTQGPRNNQSPGNFGAPVSAPQNVFFTYSADSALGLTAVGDIELTNRTDRIRSAYSPPAGQSDSQALFQGAISGEQALAVYPGTLAATALSGDIDVASRFSMFPAADGNLQLIAQGSVTAPVLISMSDANPANLPLPVRPVTTFNESALLLDGALGARVHSDPSLHTGDSEPVRIYARTGSITGNESGTPVQLPKQARIIAGEDVRDFSLLGQNVGANDVTLIAAGRDVVFTPRNDAFGNQLSGNGAIQIGGPGRLEVIAGRNIDLSTSQGILTRGNLNNPLLPEGGASITALAGAPLFAQNGTPKIDATQYLAEDATAASLPPIRLTRSGLVSHVRSVTGDGGVDETNAVQKFNALTAEQQWPLLLNAFFVALRDTGRAANSNGGNYDRGFQAIESLFPGSAYKGDLNLFFSQIKTEQGGDINMLVPGGIVNAGLANAGSFSKPASALGIVTVDGGSVRAFVRSDFLVNASRVFTLGGGDIMIWSSEGNIDAGKGAKTASATPPPLLKIDNQGNITLDTTQSVSGSGIGVLLAKTGIIPGDVDLIAPRGEVNAGDAGIRSAGNINIAAVRVVGADNIQVGGRSTGIPAGDGGNFAGALTGAGNVGSEGNRASDAAARNVAAAASAQSLQDGFRPTFISVEILGLGEGN